MTNISYGILEALREHKEIQGTEQLTKIINVHIGHKGRVFAQACTLARYGMIEMIISSGGRGVKTIYRDRGVLKVQR
jgi:hypothetical protein